MVYAFKSTHRKTVMKSDKKSYGFTLIELSIVLVIIGLIVGGVLVGSNLIKSSQLNNIMSDKEKYLTAVNIFDTKYNCLPGDCAEASNYFSAGIDGNGDGKISYIVTKPDGTLPKNGNTDDKSESLALWQHLSESKIIDGAYNGKVARWNSYCANRNQASSSNDYNPNSPTSSHHSNASFGIWHLDPSADADMTWVFGAAFTDWIHSHIITFGVCTPSVSSVSPPMFDTIDIDDMIRLDTKYDDGIPLKGTVRTTRNACNWDGNWSAGISERCGLVIRANF